MFSLNTPIVFCTFNRYKVTMDVFSRIRDARPEKLYFVSDGARTTKVGEKEEVERIRLSVEKAIDWNCELIKVFSDRNMGCAKRVSSALDYVFDREECAIILEDDCYPSPSFFEYCQTLLQLYKDDDRVMSIGGSTIIDYKPDDDIDYFFTTEFCCWGWATWKRSWKLFDYDMKDYPVRMENEKDYLKKTLFNKKAYWNYMAQWRSLFNSAHKQSWAYIFFYDSLVNKKLNIMSVNNLVRNIGFSNDATNTKKEINHYFSHVSDVSFPLRGPSEVRRNEEYDSEIYRLTQNAGLVIKIKDIFGLDINRSLVDMVLSKLDIINRIRNRIRRRSLLMKCVVQRRTIRMGNNYGGFDVVPEIIDGRKILVYSFGIGEDLSFSESILDRFDAEIFAYDPTPKSIEYVHRREILNNERFHFFPFGLSDKHEMVMFYLPQNDEWVSGSSVITKDKKEKGIEVEMRDLISLMKENGHDHIDLLKMDIEGSEFKVVDSLERLAAKGGVIPDVKQICIEVHDRYFDEGLEMLTGFITKLRSLGYELVNVSNTYEELTFIKYESTDHQYGM